MSVTDYWTISVAKAGQKWSYVLSEPGASECETHWRDAGAEVTRKAVDTGRGSERLEAEGDAHEPSAPPDEAQGRGAGRAAREDRQLVIRW